MSTRSRSPRKANSDFAHATNVQGVIPYYKISKSSHGFSGPCGDEHMVDVHFLSPSRTDSIFLTQPLHSATSTVTSMSILTQLKHHLSSTPKHAYKLIGIQRTGPVCSVVRPFDTRNKRTETYSLTPGVIRRSEQSSDP